jgi:hypothetical protein
MRRAPRRLALCAIALAALSLACLTFRGATIRVPAEARQKGSEGREEILSALDQTCGRYDLVRVEPTRAGKPEPVVAQWLGPSEGAHPSRGLQVTLRADGAEGWTVGVADWHTPGGSEQYYELTQSLAETLKPFGGTLERKSLGVWPP